MGASMGRLETLRLWNFSSFLPAVAVTIETGMYSKFHSDATHFLMALSELLLGCLSKEVSH